MIFLAPIPAIVALAIGVPALLAFYLLKLRRRTVRVSSTMFFESKSSDLQVNVPLRWLRLSLLFLLHLLVLLLLAGALARPAIPGTGGGGAVYIVIDRSASMSAADAGDGRTRLDEARARAVEIARRAMGAGSEGVAVISVAREARIVAPVTRSMVEVRRAIDSIEPADQPGDLGGALALVEALATAEAEEGADSPIGLAVILSDGLSAGGRALSVAGASVTYERVGPAETAARDNVGIVALGGARDPDDPALVRIFVRAQSVTGERVATTLDASIGDEVVGRTPLVLAGAEDGPVSASRTIELRLPEGGDVRLELARDDALASDNAVWITAEPPRRPSVLVVAPGGRADALLLDVLDALDLRTLRVMGEIEWRGLRSDDAAAFDLIVYDRVGAPDPAPVPSISFGAPIGGVELGDEVPPTRVISWDRTSPELRDVTLDAVYVGRWRPLSGRGADVRTLAEGEGGALIVRSREGGVARLVTAFELAQSNWTVQPGFAIFMAAAVDSLAGANGAEGGWFVTTQQPAIARVGGEEVRVSGPLERSVRATGSGTNVGVLERVGLYRAEGGGRTDSIAVNLLDEAASTIATRDSIEVGGREVAGDGSGSSPRREIWRWFVLGAAVLLVIEWTLAAWRMRV